MTPLQYHIINVLYKADEFLSVPAIVRRGGDIPNEIDFREVANACKILTSEKLLEQTRNAPGKKKGTYGYRLSTFMRDALNKRNSAPYSPEVRRG